MQKLKYLLLCLAVALLCSCSVGSGADVETLLRAPRLSGESSAVQRALNSYLGESATLKYPASGDFLSPFLFGDWDGDGTQEAAVLYTSDRVGPNVWLAVLEPAEDNTWRVSRTAEGLSDAVDSVTYAGLRNGSSRQILVGYSGSGGDLYLAVYLYDGDELQTVIRQSYTEMILANITDTQDTQDLVLALPTETENGGINLQLLTNYDGLFKSTQTLSLGAGVFSGCAALHAGVGSDGEPYLVADGWAGATGSYLASCIVVYNRESGYLESYTPAGMADLSRATLRYENSLLSTDVDGNGTIDIPTELEDGGILEAPVDKRLRFVLWKDYTSAGGGNTRFGIYDLEYNFFLPLPESMHGSVLLRANAAGNGWTVCNTAGTERYCELRVVNQSQAKDNTYQRIATIGSQQLQAKIITPYYGLNMNQVLEGTVLMGD